MALVLRPLSIGELLDQTFSLYRDHFRLFSGIMVVPQLAIFAVSTGTVMIPALASAAGGNSPSAAAIAGIGMVLYFPVVFVVWITAHAMAQAATAYAVSQVYLERNTTISTSYAFVRGRFWSILGVAFLTLVGMFIGVFAFFIGMLFAALFCSMAVPVTVLEGRDPWESIKRSFSLVKDDLGRIFLIMFVFVVFHWGISYVVAIPSIALMAVLSSHGQGQLWVNALLYVGEFVSGCLVGPLLNVAIALAYYDERVRKEAFDMQFMMAAIDRNAMAAAAAVPGGLPISPPV